MTNQALCPTINPEMMFVDWRSVNARFCGLMWIIALVLAIVILANVGNPSGDTQHSPRSARPATIR
jgi:hypothetical protein